MSVIIRLQNLSWNAHALDIRQFFKGMSIPDGGVHIVGGDLGDAFIAFSTDEDARRAMILNGDKLNGVPVKLFLSSKTEMQKVIALARGAPMDKDERPTVVLPQMNAPPPFGGSGSIPNSGSFSHPPPPISLQQQNLPHSQMPLLGSPNFNQASSTNFPFSSAGSRYPTPAGVQPMMQYPNKLDRSPRMPQRPDILRTDRPDNLNREAGGQRRARAGIVRYDKVSVDPLQKQTSDIMLKPDIARDERQGNGHNGRSGSYERRDTKRTERRDDLSRNRHDDRFFDGRGGERRDRSRAEDDRKGGRERQEGYRQQDRYERRRYDDRSRRYDRTERRRGESRERESRKRDRRSDQSNERKHENDRYRRDSADHEKRLKYGRDGDRKGDDFRNKDQRSGELLESRSTYGTGVSEDKYENQPDPGTCAFLSHLPMSISYKDVRRLFSKEQLRLPENGLKLENDEFGNRNGNAYVMFTLKEFRDKAIEMNGTYLEGNPIRVERCSLLEFEQAIDSFVPQDNRRKGIEKAEQQFHDHSEYQPDMISHSPAHERNKKDFFCNVLCDA